MDRLTELNKMVTISSEQLRNNESPIATIVDNVYRSIYEDLLNETGHEGWEGTSMILIDTLCELRQLTSDLIIRVNEQVPVIEDLQTKVSSLEERVTKLEGDQEKLIAGQLAFMVEKELLVRVFADSKCPSPDDLMLYSIKSMEKAIKRKDPYNTTFTDEQCKQVSENWKKLKDQLGWRSDHYVGVRELKEQRLKIAHPDKSISEIKTTLPKVPLSSKVKQVCTDFIRFIDQLKKM